MDAVAVGSILSIVGALAVFVVLSIRVVNLIKQDEQKHKQK